MSDIINFAGLAKEAFWNDSSSLGRIAQEYLKKLLEGKRREAMRLIAETAGKGVGIQDIYIHIFQAAQHEVGRLWQTNTISVAQEHYCTAAAQMAMAQLYPKIFSSPKNGRKLVAACVTGELHEIGMRMVADLMEMDGWDTHYLGASAPAESIVEYAAAQKADLLAISATITFNLGAAKSLIGMVRESEKCNNIRIIVGGRLFNLASDLWRQVGADAYAGDAQQACAEANRMFGLSQNI